VSDSDDDYMLDGNNFFSFVLSGQKVRIRAEHHYKVRAEHHYKGGTSDTSSNEDPRGISIEHLCCRADVFAVF